MSKKVKYQFNTKSLAVEKVHETFWDKLKVFLRIVFAGMVFSVIVLSIGYTVFDSPKEKRLRREIEQYKTQYQIINDRLDILNAVMGDIQERDDHIYRVIFEADPIPRTVREAAFGGSDRYSHLEGFDNSQLISSTMQRIDLMSRQLYVQSRSYDEVFEMAKNKADMLASIPAIIPIAKGTERLVSGFGFRIHPIYKSLRMHTGVDFTAPTGTPIYATGNGVVKRAQRDNSGYGLMVEVDHGYGYTTIYAHMSQVKVRVGQTIKRGEVIGLVGNTGLSSGPHLHYEVIRNGKKVNPVNYFYNDLSPEEFDIIFELASRVNQSLS
ncbi:MAG: M23 family metallopeptidase [Bacteroidales bacterium]|jgi:murein DD-endopeptidase MepM/ murein hydrolase activator NlpD|nr:M23 family metallopeptidase [Bacteroidales bacterium]NLM93338.1 M23 family metallopeptidase [Bacteroidales bacterium]